MQLLILYLHSTMYLFQPVDLFVAYMCIIIYIPLCIYFNAEYGKTGTQCKYIYIPLCIYFNNAGHCGSGISNDIYIPLCIYFNCD